MSHGEPLVIIDCRAGGCPLPILDLARHIGDVAGRATITVEADDPAAGPDIAAWCRMRGHEFVGRATADGRHARLHRPPSALSDSGILADVCGLIGFLSAGRTRQRSTWRDRRLAEPTCATAARTRAACGPTTTW